MIKSYVRDYNCSDGHKGIQKAVENLYWIKLADVPCASDKASSKKDAKREAEEIVENIKEAVVYR